LLQGNLSAFVEKKPEAKSYYDLKEASIKFTLPEPGFLEGVKSKDRAILKMHSVGYTCVLVIVTPSFVFIPLLTASCGDLSISTFTSTVVRRT
jgi:hypothetical protein